MSEPSVAPAVDHVRPTPTGDAPANTVEGAPEVRLHNAAEESATVGDAASWPGGALAKHADATLYEISAGDLPPAPKDPLMAAVREGRGQEWIADHRAQIWIVGIGAMTIGSILCMMVLTIVLIITRTR